MEETLQGRGAPTEGVDMNRTLPGGELGRLLDVEERLQGLLEERRQEARNLVDEARATAARRRQEAEAAIEAETLDLRRSIAQDAKAQVTAILAGGRRRIERYRDVPEPVLNELAERVLHRLIEDERRS
jgi:vacuolar-type H+-ATPase subunit H